MSFPQYSVREADRLLIKPQLALGRKLRPYIRQRLARAPQCVNSRAEIGLLGLSLCPCLAQWPTFLLPTLYVDMVAHGKEAQVWLQWLRSNCPA